MHNEIQTLNAYRNNLTGQKSRLSGKASQTEEQIGQWLTEKAQYQTRLEDIHTVLGELDKTLSIQKTQMESLGNEEIILRQQLDEVKEQRSGLQGELNVLQEMENRRQGLSETVKAILEEQKQQPGQWDYIEGVLADMLQVDVDCAPAVEAALGSSLQALLISSTHRFLADKTLQEKMNSRLQVCCLDRIDPFRDQADLRRGSGILGRLIEFVRYEGRYAPLLSLIHI